MRILVAEDDRASLAMLERTLEKWGHEVVAARDGEEAWRLYREQPVTIVVSDWIMPGMAGTELCRAIRAHRGSSYTFFILLTAKDDRSSLLEAFEAGVDDFISKPFDPDELRARLRVGERMVELEQALAGRIRDLDAANHKMKNDLKAAARIQESLLPAQPPDSQRVRFAWRLHPCAELAGDLLNVFPLGEHSFGMYVLDVSGHGVAASLMSVTLSRLLLPTMHSSLVVRKRGEQELIVPPHEVLEALNQRFPIEQTPGGRYFTIVYGVLDEKRGRFRYANAGHPAPIWQPAGEEPRELDGASFPIGFHPEPGYATVELDVSSGGRLFLYSDGILEYASAQQELLGAARFSRMLQELSDRDMSGTVSAVLAEAARWSGGAPPSDDISLLAAEIDASGPKR